MYKSQTHDIMLGEVVGLIHADELMGTEELENLPLYAYELWKNTQRRTKRKEHSMMPGWNIHGIVK